MDHRANASGQRWGCDLISTPTLPPLGAEAEASVTDPASADELLEQLGLVTDESAVRSVSWTFTEGRRPIRNLRAVLIEWWPSEIDGTEHLIWFLTGNGVAGRLDLIPPPGPAGRAPPGIAPGHLGPGVSPDLLLGLAAETALDVDQANTTDHLGTGLPLLTTPAMVVAMEQTAADLISPFLEPGYGAVGAHNDIAHSRPAYLHETVRFRAVLIGGIGHRLSYYVDAVVNDRVVGHGRHENHVVRPAAHQRR